MVTTIVHELIVESRQTYPDVIIERVSKLKSTIDTVFNKAKHNSRFSNNFDKLNDIQNQVLEVINYHESEIKREINEKN